MSTVEIPLSQGKVAIVDYADLPLIRGFTWYTRRRRHTCYAVASLPGDSSGVKVLMHRLILGLSDSGLLVDHRDGNGLNNARDNLRIATTLENCLNQAKAKGISKFKGVYPVNRKRSHRRWCSRIKANGIRISLGLFRTEEEAAAAYDEAASRYFGPFAKLNFPPQPAGA